jgi:hypothetical protein
MLCPTGALLLNRSRQRSLHGPARRCSGAVVCGHSILPEPTPCPALCRAGTVGSGGPFAPPGPMSDRTRSPRSAVGSGGCFSAARPRPCARAARPSDRQAWRGSAGRGSGFGSPRLAGPRPPPAPRPPAAAAGSAGRRPARQRLPTARRQCPMLLPTTMAGTRARCPGRPRQAPVRSAGARDRPPGAGAVGHGPSAAALCRPGRSPGCIQRPDVDHRPDL